MSDLMLIEERVLHFMETIKQLFDAEFKDVNSNDYTALIDSENEVLGVGVSRASALADAEQNLGYEAITQFFIKDAFTAIKLTRSAFELMIDCLDSYRALTKVGEYRLSNVMIASVKTIAVEIDSLLKRVNEDHSFTFEVKDVNEDSDERQAFVFKMKIDGDILDGGFVRASVIEKGQWLTVKQDLSCIADGFENTIKRANESQKMVA